jgi:hypothetical protein
MLFRYRVVQTVNHWDTEKRRFLNFLCGSASPWFKEAWFTIHASPPRVAPRWAQMGSASEVDLKELAGSVLSQRDDFDFG